MDEPTAALDSKSENYIRDSIAQLIKGKTVLMVTHRKALLSMMDTIYVMEDGNLKNVHDYGGLDAYLAKITDTEAGTNEEIDRAKALESERLAQQQRHLSELEIQNEQLQKKLDVTSQQTQPNDGTVYIDH